jgi:stress response protein SCP2
MHHQSIAKGHNSLLAISDGMPLDLELSWSPSSADQSIDLFMVLLTGEGTVRSNDDLIFYNQTASPCGSVKYLGSGAHGHNRYHRARLQLSSMPADIHSVIIAVNTDAENLPLGQVNRIQVALTAQSGIHLTIPGDGLDLERAAVLCEVYRRDGGWKARSICQGWTDGIEQLLTERGLSFEDPAPEVTTVPAPAQQTARLSRLNDLEHRIKEREAVLASLEARIVETRNLTLLQDLGIYDFAHPLDGAVQYKERLASLKTEYSNAAKERGVIGATNWAVNGSVAEGAKMIKEQCKLVLRAYNAEADNCVRTVRAHNLEANLKRLDKAKESIQRLGRSMSIHITDEYHALRCQEVRLTADYHLKVAEEKEQLRAEREELREQEKVERELRQAREKLEREQNQYLAALEIARKNGDRDAILDMEMRLETVSEKLIDVENRESNAKAGYVYVISNLGAFGDRIVKIGMTRRMEPQERIRELSGAGVPFLYDVHALIFSDDALGLESRLHQLFAARRVNRVNTRREFFYASPHEVVEVVKELVGQTTLEFNEDAEAFEFRQSLIMAKDS